MKKRKFDDFNQNQYQNYDRDIRIENLENYFKIHCEQINQYIQHVNSMLNNMSNKTMSMENRINLLEKQLRNRMDKEVSDEDVKKKGYFDYYCA